MQDTNIPCNPLNELRRMASRFYMHSTKSDYYTDDERLLLAELATRLEELLLQYTPMDE